MNKKASILDYQKEILCPEIWAEDNQLLPSVEEFILFSLKDFCEHNGLKNPKVWIKDCLIASSLASYFYTSYSDFDVKCIIEMKAFLKENPSFKNQSTEQILDLLKDLGRKSSFLTATIPGTLHSLDFYFYSAADKEIFNLYKYDSLYSINKEEWIKPPKRYEELEYNEDILDIAFRKAEPYIERISEDIDNTKRDVIDFLIFKDFVRTLEESDLFKVKNLFLKHLDQINIDLDNLIEDREVVKYLRKEEFKRNDLRTNLERIMGSLNYSDGNLIFKIIQRYGYMQILSEIDEIFSERDATPTDAEKILSILSGSNTITT